MYNFQKELYTDLASYILAEDLKNIVYILNKIKQQNIYDKNNSWIGKAESFIFERTIPISKNNI
jgi:hypothetical protein